MVVEARERAVLRALAEPLHPGMVALGISARGLHRATRDLLASPIARIA
ncbi:MAG TPA: hypothetical protein VIV11_07490 [Kofleriaceae bacterium]